MRLLVARIVIACVAVLLLLGRYGTLEPCGMLRADVQRRVLAAIAEGEAAPRLGSLASAQGMGTLDQMLRATTAERSPGECLTALVRFHGDPEVRAWLASSPPVDDLQ